MKWKELSPIEFLALERALDEFDFEAQARDYMEESQDYNDVRGKRRDFERLAEGHEGLSRLKEKLSKLDGPPIILFNLPEDN